MNCFKIARFFLVSAALTISLHGAEFYAILVADTLDATLAASCKSDLTNMKREMNCIAKYAGLNLHLTILHGKQATTTNLINQIYSINPGKDDVVLFYCSSHGYHLYSQTDVWPNIFLGQSGKGIHILSIHEILANKNPRLLISVADVCNNSFNDIQAPPTILLKDMTKAIDSKKIRMNYKNLFSKATGSIVLAASQAGKYSYSYMTKGSLLTFSFLDAIKYETAMTANPSWNKILQNTVTNTESRAHALNVEQVPQYLISE